MEYPFTKSQMSAPFFKTKKKTKNPKEQMGSTRHTQTIHMHMAHPQLHHWKMDKETTHP